MLTALRTYRLLPTLLGLSLLLSVVSPLVQTACAMEQNGLHGTHACHHDDAPSSASTDALTPHGAHEGNATHEEVAPFAFDAGPCCIVEPASTVVAATLIAKTSLRDAGRFLLALLPHTVYEGTDNTSPLTRASASRLLTDFPPIDRQALLATFLN